MHTAQLANAAPAVKLRPLMYPFVLVSLCGELRLGPSIKAVLCRRSPGLEIQTPPPCTKSWFGQSTNIPLNPGSLSWWWDWIAFLSVWSSLWSECPEPGGRVRTNPAPPRTLCPLFLLTWLLLSGCPDTCVLCRPRLVCKVWLSFSFNIYLTCICLPLDTKPGMHAGQACKGGPGNLV